MLEETLRYVHFKLVHTGIIHTLGLVDRSGCPGCNAMAQRLPLLNAPSMGGVTISAPTVMMLELHAHQVCRATVGGLHFKSVILLPS